jgi:hypothetical protein
VKRGDEDTTLSMGVRSDSCPQCGTLKNLPDFTFLTAYVCESCGAGVRVSGQPVGVLSRLT